MTAALMVAWLLGPVAALAEAPPMVSAREWGSRPKTFPEEMKHTPRILVVHHEGVAWKPGSDPREKMRRLQSWGMSEKGWLDVPYHYAIAPDGQIFEGRDWHFQPDSNTSYPLNGVLNVELMGNFEVEPVPGRQLESLVRLLAYLCQRHGLKPGEITSHRGLAPGQTVCPGRDLQRYLDGPLKVWTAWAIRGQAPSFDWWLWSPPEVAR